MGGLSSIAPCRTAALSRRGGIKPERRCDDWNKKRSEVQSHVNSRATRRPEMDWKNYLLTMDISRILSVVKHTNESMAMLVGFKIQLLEANIGPTAFGLSHYHCKLPSYFMFFENLHKMILFLQYLYFLNSCKVHFFRSLNLQISFHCFYTYQ